MNTDTNLNIDNQDEMTQNLLKERESEINQNNKEQSQYKSYINSYDEACEVSSQIDYLLFLTISPFKFVLFILINVITFGIINLINVWFPSTLLSVLYSNAEINQSSYVGVFCKDGKFYIIPLNKITLPTLNNSTPFIRYTKSVIVSYFKEVYLFSFKKFTYVYDNENHAFTNLSFELNCKNEDIIKDLSIGLSYNESEYQKSFFGKCDLDIEIKSFLALLFDEFSDPFYLFQIFSFILWINNGYQAYAYVIIVTTIISLLISSYETRSNLLNIQRMARYKCDIKVLRDGQLIEVSSEELVPGDVFTLPEDGLALPCDALLLKGSAIVNEAMLTGESTPIFKTGLNPSSGDFKVAQSTKHILYAGTKIIQKRYIYSKNNKNDSKTLSALVLSTSFNTKKGRLIRSILYPKQVDFKFKKDSIRYIYIMAILSFVGFIISLPFLIKSGMSAIAIAKRSLDLVTTTVPPALPACLGIGITYALTRLRKHQITCINRERVNIAGKVDMICFDKTGTLTEDHLDIWGFVPTKFSNEKIVFNDFSNDCKLQSLKAFDHYKKKLLSNEHDKGKDLNQLYIECLACCHSITRVNGKLLGDPIDVKMFESTGWTLNENEGDELISKYVRPSQEKSLQEKLASEDVDEEKEINSHYEIGIVKCFDFSSQLQRMSVITKNSNDKYFKVFVKGSPEKIKELCKPESIPDNFGDILNSYTLKGARVLALGGKMLKMDYLQSQKITREKVESNLIFLGLLIVRNQLKEKTLSSIQELLRAKLRMVMATGDNILTAIAVSKECNLIMADATVYTCDINKDTNSLEWNLVENYTDAEKFELIGHVDEMQRQFNGQGDEKSNNDLSEGENDGSINDKLNTITKHFEPESVSEEDEDELKNDAERRLLGPVKDKNDIAIDIDLSLAIDIEKIPKTAFDPLNEEYIIAISGTTFESLYKFHKKFLETQDEKYLIHYNTFRLILKNCIIFARMSPDHKTMLVQSLREEKFTVLMCGDGANDCGALKSAHVGVSLSTEEASIAAHFSSEVFDISCISKLLLEGKASLVTSIQTFKYMMLYSLIQFISVTMLMILGSYLSDYQFLTSDLFIIFPIAFLISRTEATEKLTHHRPTGALISVPIVTSILSQTALMFLFQLIGWYALTFNNWYENYCANDEEKVFACYDNTVVFLISNMQYLISAIAFSISYPFKKSIFTNYLLILCLFLAFSYSAYLIIIPDEGSMNILDLAVLPSVKFKYFLLLISASNCIVCYLVEKFVVPLISKKWKTHKYNNIKKVLKEKSINYNLNQLEKLKKFSM